MIFVAVKEVYYGEHVYLLKSKDINEAVDRIIKYITEDKRDTFDVSIKGIDTEQQTADIYMKEEMPFYTDPFVVKLSPLTFKPRRKVVYAGGYEE